MLLTNGTSCARRVRIASPALTRAPLAAPSSLDAMPQPPPEENRNPLLLAAVVFGAGVLLVRGRIGGSGEEGLSLGAPPPSPPFELCDGKAHARQQEGSAPFRARSVGPLPAPKFLLALTTYLPSYPLPLLPSPVDWTQPRPHPRGDGQGAEARLVLQGTPPLPLPFHASPSTQIQDVNGAGTLFLWAYRFNGPITPLSPVVLPQGRLPRAGPFGARGAEKEGFQPLQVSGPAGRVGKASPAPSLFYRRSADRSRVHVIAHPVGVTVAYVVARIHVSEVKWPARRRARRLVSPRRLPRFPLDFCFCPVVPPPPVAAVLLRAFRRC